MPFKDAQTRRFYFRKRYNSLRGSWFDKNGPCSHCGSWDQLEVDHIDPSQKESGTQIWNWSEERRNAELVKCQVLCKQCHGIKTAAENTKPLIHGTMNAYQQKGCKCEKCRGVNAASKRVWREKMRGNRVVTRGS